MVKEPTREELLEAAVIDLTIAASTFADGRGRTEARKNLKSAIHRGVAVLKNKPCEIDPVADLRDLADAADAEMAEEPTYRRDIDG